MSSGVTGIRFKGCIDSDVCDAALFEMSDPAQTVEVRITVESESILARELGKEELTARDREAILSLAGMSLIEECQEQHGHIDPELLLGSDYLFRRPGMERGLLREAGLLAEGD